MSILDTLERKFGKYIPENVTKFLLIGQGAGFLLILLQPGYESFFFLSGRQLYMGQLWRLITFLFAPVAGGLLYVILALYFFYILGTALERQWGSFRYVCYIGISFIAAIVFSLLFPDVPVTNIYLYTTLFLAFAHLFPNFQLLLFFIIPIKVKWLGYIAWIGLIATFLTVPWPQKVFIVLSISNFLCFFSNDIWYMFWSLFRSVSTQPQRSFTKKNPHHICAVCGRNEIDDPDMEIRYCTQCFPTTCYCGEHSKKHQHKRVVN